MDRCISIKISTTADACKNDVKRASHPIVENRVAW